MMWLLLTLLLASPAHSNSNCKSKQIHQQASEIDKFLREQTAYPWYRFQENGYSIEKVKRNKDVRPKGEDPNLSRPVLP